VVFFVFLPLDTKLPTYLPTYYMIRGLLLAAFTDSQVAKAPIRKGCVMQAFALLLNNTQSYNGNLSGLSRSAKVYEK